MPGLAVRPFGVQPGDLDVEFDAGDRAEVATAVLAGCVLAPDGAPLGGERARALPIGTRLGALVAVTQLSGRRELSRVFRCAGCDEEFEVELALDALACAQEAAEADAPAAVEWGGTTYRPRRPTGDDLRRWRGRPPPDAEIAEALGGPDDEAPPSCSPRSRPRSMRQTRWWMQRSARRARRAEGRSSCRSTSRASCSRSRGATRTSCSRTSPRWPARSTGASTTSSRCRLGAGARYLAMVE